MKYQVQSVVISIVLLMTVMGWAVAYDPNFTWQNVDPNTISDLKHRMKRRTPTRRRQCECAEVDEEDNYFICASNGALYENACLFKCAQVRLPNLTEVDITECGTHTFKEFKMKEFRSHY